MAVHPASPLLSVRGVRKSFRQSGGEELLVLDDVNLDVEDGEIIALLGRSGSGKSTLLRIIAGLTPPTSGEVSRHSGAADVGMVFQSFALFPWLTVLQNVELGLEAQGVDRAERRQRAVAAIDLIGLDGFESAYPRELSGGMRQRVGFARALVVEPELLLMDEPFSALDVLTAETLRNDLLGLWAAQRIKTRAIVIVTHNIEEAVLLADRILVLSSSPGRIAADLPVLLPRPRVRDSAAFRMLVDHVYGLLTERGIAPQEAVPSGVTYGGLAYPLPAAPVGQVIGLLDELAGEPFNGQADLPELADEAGLPLGTLFSLLDALEILGFAQVSAGDIEMTSTGTAFADAGILERKQLFAARLMERIPLAAHIRRTLEERPGQRSSSREFFTSLADILGEAGAESVLATVIEWGRYAELFAFDDHADELFIEAPGD